MYLRALVLIRIEYRLSKSIFHCIFKYKIRTFKHEVDNYLFHFNHLKSKLRGRELYIFNICLT